MSVPVLVPFSRRRATYPVSGFQDFDRAFDNLFRNALSNFGASAGQAGDLNVRMDVSETDKAYSIALDLPGIDQKDVELTVEDGVLTLSGERHAEKEEEGRTFHRVERTYGRFRRALQLPGDADGDRVSAAMRNGVLNIEIAKLETKEKPSRKIEIAHD